MLAGAREAQHQRQLLAFNQGPTQPDQHQVQPARLEAHRVARGQFDPRQLAHLHHAGFDGPGVQLDAFGHRGTGRDERVGLAAGVATTMKPTPTWTPGR